MDLIMPNVYMSQPCDLRTQGGHEQPTHRVTTAKPSRSAAKVKARADRYGHGELFFWGVPAMGPYQPGQATLPLLQQHYDMDSFDDLSSSSQSTASSTPSSTPSSTSTPLHHRHQPFPSIGVEGGVWSGGPYCDLRVGSVGPSRGGGDAGDGGDEDEVEARTLAPSWGCDRRPINPALFKAMASERYVDLNLDLLLYNQCLRCGLFIHTDQDRVSVKGAAYHHHCFSCTKCDIPLTLKTYRKLVSLTRSQVVRVSHPH